jgi:hypothetical protein
MLVLSNIVHAIACLKACTTTLDQAPVVCLKETFEKDYTVPLTFILPQHNCTAQRDEKPNQ